MTPDESTALLPADAPAPAGEATRGGYTITVGGCASGTGMATRAAQPDGSREAALISALAEARDITITFAA